MNYYEEIRNELIKNETKKLVKDYSKNISDLLTCYNVGKLLIEAQGGEGRAKYGDGLIKEYSKKLSREVDKRYNSTMLKRTRQFYLIIQKGATLSHQLTWSHYIELLSIRNTNEIDYYINTTEKENLSVRQLRERIKNNEYGRLSENAKKKLINKEELSLEDTIKDPIIIRNNGRDVTSEYILKELIRENIEHFLEQLGSNYAYINTEYKIPIANRNNYIDILLFNIDKNCYVVVELKNNELKKEYFGQIGIYMKAVDKHLKKIYHNDTEGILITRKNNKLLYTYIENDKIHSREFKLLNEPSV